MLINFVYRVMEKRGICTECRDELNEWIKTRKAESEE